MLASPMLGVRGGEEMEDFLFASCEEELLLIGCME
jgi:hypothetical protein